MYTSTRWRWVHITADILLPELRDRLWHTTHPDRFRSILASEAILPVATNPDGWKALGGGNYCPYARKLGGVSLFDFTGFDPDSYQRRCPSCSWYEYVPHFWKSAVWIELTPERITENLISASAVVTRWNAEKAYRHPVMPYIEAIHIGPVPRAAFKRAFLVTDDDNDLHPLAML